MATADHVSGTSRKDTADAREIEQAIQNYTRTNAIRLAGMLLAGTIPLSAQPFQ